ncbi:MAG: glycosyltransferase [Alphaproteobacteria bacterium]|nr:glycosyltransferase [Alphaproteobacteria bacterium]
MKILITNHALDRRAGTELYVRDLALALKRNGHQPACYAPVLGAVADDIRALGIPVSDRPDAGEPPDILHCHHHHAAALACLARPETPAIYICHGVKPWQEAPLARFPNIRRYVAVDRPCREFLVKQGIPDDRIDLVLNGVDLERFAYDRPAQEDPDRQKRALLISNVAGPADLQPFRDACRANGMTLEFAGVAGTVMESPETELPRYGLVFAKARAALEAMASGCAVILADYGKTGVRITTANFGDLRPANFGFSVINDPPDVSALTQSIAEIDWADAALVTVRVREIAGFDAIAGQYEKIYEQLDTPPMNEGPDLIDAARNYFERVLPHLQERDALAGRLYREVSDRIERDRRLAALIKRVRTDRTAWPELLAAARHLDPSNSDL